MMASAGQETAEETAEIKASETECQEHEQEDRISNLPDDILMCVLDKLELPSDVVRTSMLSKRWRHLPASLRNNVSVIEATKSILSYQSENTINSLGIRFYLRDESIDIVRSVDKAMEKRKVLKAEFSILTELPDAYNTDDNMLDYGRRFMTFVDACPRAFGGLTHLCLHSLRLSTSDFYNVLNTCKKLESLRLNNCDAGNQSVVQIEHQQLAVLVIVSCGLKRIELIWLPTLTRLTCQNWVPSKDEYPLSFHHVPQLQGLTLTTAGTTLHKTFVLSEFLGNAMISKLDLNFICQRIWIQPEGKKLLAPKLQNLQIVGLRLIHEECDLQWTMFLLEAAPLLKELNMQVWDHMCYPIDDAWQTIYQKASDLLNWETRGGFKHYNMRKLYIEGFQLEEMFTKYIRCVVEAAVNLELVTLRESRPCAHCQFYPSRAYPRTDEEKNLTIKQIPDRKSLYIKFEQNRA